jgi:hypothetical protein
MYAEYFVFYYENVALNLLDTNFFIVLYLLNFMKVHIIIIQYIIYEIQKGA